MANYYISSLVGSDATGDGSIGSPWATFLAVNSGALWARGNNILVQRGSVILVGPTTRANINVTSGSGRCVLSAYGSGALPVIDGFYATHNPVWVRGGSAIDISNINVTQSASAGLKVSPLSGNSVDDVTLTNVTAYENGLIGSTGSGATGILVTREVGGVACTNVIVTDCIAQANRGHGIKFSDCATGRVVLSRAVGNGTGAPAHGMGTVGAYTWLSLSTAWTNVSGNIWSITVGALGSTVNGQSTTATQNIIDWLAVGAGDSASITTAAQTHLTKSATPATPGINEFGISGANTLLVNFGGTDPRTLFIKGAYNTPSVVFDRCVSSGTLDYNGFEGSGFQFDDLTIGCTVRNCQSTGNQGYGFVGYGGVGNRCVQSILSNNTKGGAFALTTKNMKIIGNTIDSNTGPAISTHKGVTTTAMKNAITNHAVGFQSNSATEYLINENENEYYNVTTLRTNVAAGSKTVALTAVKRLAYKATSRKVSIA